VVAYPVASIPQAWAAAAPILLLQARLGPEIGDRPRTLSLSRTTLPHWLAHVELRDIRLGQARVSIACHRQDATTGYSVLERHGDVDVVMRG